MIRWTTGALTLLLVASALGTTQAASRGENLDRYEYTLTYMGNPTRILFYTDSEEVAERAATAAFRRMAELEKVFSGPNSELAAFVRDGSGSSVRLSDDLYAALSESLDISRKTGGAFDMTLRPLFGVWGKARNENRLPTREEIAEARSQMGWEKVQLDSRTKMGRIAQKGISADLNALAKGYVAEEVVEELKRQGISRAFFDSGGDIVAGDPPPGQKGWRVELDNVAPEKPQFVLLANASVSGAGEPERFAEIQGKRYSYAINARTGMVGTEGVAVTVIAPTGAAADGLATALSAYGVEDGCRLVRTLPGVHAYFRRVTVEGGGMTGRPEVKRVVWTSCGE